MGYARDPGGVYNLLDLSNGADTLLATGLTLQGRINKIKLVLGNSNSGGDPQRILSTFTMERQSSITIR